MRRMCRPLALAGIAGLGAGIFTFGLATLGQQPDVPFSATVIAALGILWGTVTVAWPTRRQGGTMNASNNHMRGHNGR